MPFDYLSWLGRDLSFSKFSSLEDDGEIGFWLGG